MPTYTITLTMSNRRRWSTSRPMSMFWIQNAVHERARLAVEEMVQTYIQDRLAKGETISGTREEIVMTSGLPNAQERSEAMAKQMMENPPPGTFFKG